MQKGDASGALGAARVYIARQAVWAMRSAEQGTLVTAMAYMRPSLRSDTEVADPSSISSGFIDAYDIDLEADY